MSYDQIIDVRLLAPLATSVAIVVSIVLWLFNQRRKLLSYRVLKQDEHGATVQIMNNGHIPIVPGDYHSRLTIQSGPGSEVMEAQIVSTAPGDLEERCRNGGGVRKKLIEDIQANEVVLSQVLLNEGDSLVVRFTAEDFRGGVKVVGHINGVRRVTPWHPKTLVATLLRTVGIFIMVSSFFIVEPSAVLKYGLAEALPTVLFFLLGYTLLWSGMFSKRIATKSVLEPRVECT
jgi:hypothetical protein